MDYAPIAADLAVRLTRAHINSARPDAPVVPDPPARPQKRRWWRRSPVWSTYIVRLSNHQRPSMRWKVSR